MLVKELLSDESKWTKGAFAKRITGERVHCNDPTAVCWSLLGAIHRCYTGTIDDKCERLNATIRDMHGDKYSDIIGFNDAASFEQVQAVLEKAGV